MKRVVILWLFTSIFCLVFAGTPRILTQKLSCVAPYQILDYVTNTGTTTSSNYIVRADILETTGEEVGTDLGTTAANLRLYKAGNGTTVPYFAAITIQLGQFSTQWVSGNTLRLTVTYTPTNEVSPVWDIVIPTGTSTVTINDPIMTVPPTPAIELTPPEVQISISEPNCILSWNAIAGATSYKVYSSNDVLGSFSLVGTSSQTSYIMPITTRYAFYKVTSTNNRAESNPSTIQGYIRTECVPGLNMIGLPLRFDQISTAELGNPYNSVQTLISQIAKFNKSNNDWETSVFLGDSCWSPVLPISAGDVVFIGAVQSFNFYTCGEFIQHQQFARFTYNNTYQWIPVYRPLDYNHGYMDIYFETNCGFSSFWNAQAQAWWGLWQVDPWGDQGGNYFYSGFDWVGNPFIMTGWANELWPDWMFWTSQENDMSMHLPMKRGGVK